ncbi:MAG: hypothetical protein KDK70_29005, partial [Myxococcales bacterium]|nr:hypothetical protein [Myxococcales bacterium]
VYAVDPSTGTLTLVGNEIPIHFGGQSRILLHLYYTVGEWEVEIASEGSASETFETSNGSLRYFIEPDHADYVFTSTEAQQGSSTTMSMAPVPPGEIIIMPDSSCPPD